MSALKISQLPDTTPVKMNIALQPTLQADLQDCAKVYEQIYGHPAKVAELIPPMLEAFMASDSSFKKARKTLVT